ncbi:MAG TPA: short-chain fatty acid transporter, partial [Candidatus Avacidaminococcus intestinavium]|nr:short-chain fatty acid transporter [Candidatus Avacidaminococcus intestinavium]
VTGYALAKAPIVFNVLKRLAMLPKTNVQAIMLTSLIGSITTYIHWGFGLVAGALIAKEIAVLNRGKKIHYALLIAAAYSGNLCRGPSSTIFLAVTDPNNVASKFVGAIPLSETLFSTGNIIMTLILLFSIPILYKFMMPPEDQVVELSDEAYAKAIAEKNVIPQKATSEMTFAERVENSWILQTIVALGLGTYIVINFIKDPTFNLSINMLILIFLVLGMLAHKTPLRYGEAIKDATRTADGMILQFPFYAAIMGMLSDTGMSTAISKWFISISTAETLPLFSFYAAGLINLFIPSGGGLWAIQGPIILEAAKILGADPAAVIVGMGWGDSWTSQMQPFWALPLLAIAGLDVNDIMGYCFFVLILSGAVISTTLLLI